MKTCDCLFFHRTHPAPETVDGHTYRRQDDVHEVMTDMERWRWTCDCGRYGQWTIQSPNVPYHAWLRAHGWSHETHAQGMKVVEALDREEDAS